MSEDITVPVKTPPSETKKRFMFLYLNTGGGHRSAANVLKEVIHTESPDTEVTLLNGFDKKNWLGILMFEKYYHFATNWAPGLYSAAYRAGQSDFFQDFMVKCINPHTVPFLAGEFTKNQPTDVIVFHFALANPVIRALKKAGIKANVSVIVLDPFTCHFSWFYEKKVKYLVYSEAVKKEAIENGIPENNIQVVPFLIGNKYRVAVTQDETAALRKKYGIPDGKKVLLLTGGGEGLPNMVAIVTECIRRHADYSVIVVCGRDKSARKTLELMASVERNRQGAHKGVDIKVFGFVNFMDELVKCCDCAVLKAGPASMVEALSCRKPVVLCHFIYGQELGNVEFAIQNHVGVFLRKSKDICNYVDRLFNDEAYAQDVRNHLENLPLDLRTENLARMLLSSEQPQEQKVAVQGLHTQEGEN